MKKCTKCGESKPSSAFFAEKKQAGGFRSSCKECDLVLKRAWRSANKDKISAGSKKWHDAHPGFTRQYKAAVRLENPEKAREWERNKRKKLLQKPHRLAEHKIRIAIRYGIKKGRWTAPVQELIGCTFRVFKTWIESKFHSGMSWEMVLDGRIHLDHIRPVSSFNILDPEEAKACFHWSNTQPLWPAENIAKGKRLPGDKRDIFSKVGER